MTDFIVHIGDGKCGSTSIQKALYDARANLRDHGIVYETAVPASAHFNMVTLAGYSTRGDYEVHSAQARNTVEMIRAATGPQDTVLLSAESFFVLPPVTLVSILNMLSDRIDRLDIIAYVRPPSGMYLSLVQQILKGNSRYTKPDAYLRRVDQNLGHWAAYEPKTSLTVRLFDRARLHKGDAVEDFAEVLRQVTGKPGIHLQGASENTSLSSEQLVVLQAMRMGILKDVEGKIDARSNKLITYFEALNSGGMIGHPLRLSADALHVVTRQNARVVSALNSMFPGLDMPGASVDTRVVPDPVWAKTEAVSAILNTTDPELVALLKSLSPPFNQQLRKGPTERSSAALVALQALFPDSRDTIARATLDYWRRDNCLAAAAALEAELGWAPPPPEEKPEPQPEPAPQAVAAALPAERVADMAAEGAAEGRAERVAPPSGAGYRKPAGRRRGRCRRGHSSRHCPGCCCRRRHGHGI
jgi:hypothetical protein